MGEDEVKEANQIEGRYLTFRLADEVYAVNALKIKEVAKYRRSTRVPRLSPVVKGVIDLRGTILPIFDLRVKFDLDTREDETKAVIVVVEILGRVMGMLVDDVIDVIHLDQASLQLTPPLSPKIRTDFIKAFGKRDNDLIILLDLDRILSMEELEELDAIK